MDGKHRQPAMARAVNAMMRALGGATVSLRIPASGIEGLERELGITATTYQEFELSPVVFRNAGIKDGREQVEVLVSSIALDALVPACGVPNGMDLLNKVQAIVSGERVFVVTGISVERFAGVEYMYRLAATE